MADCQRSNRMKIYILQNEKSFFIMYHYTDINIALSTTYASFKGNKMFETIRQSWLVCVG